MKKLLLLIFTVISSSVLISSNKQSKLENPLQNQIIQEKKIGYQQGNKQYYPVGKRKKNHHQERYRKKK